MADSSGRKIKDSYDALLILESDSITSSYKRVQDGLGVNTGLHLKDTGAKVESLEIVNVADAATGNISALAIESGSVKKKTIYPFGQGAKDVYEGFWYYTSAASPIAATAGTQVLVSTDQSTAVTVYKPSDITANPYTAGTKRWFTGFDEGTGYNMTLSLVVNTSATASTYVEIGLDVDNNGVAETQIQDFAVIRGAGAANPITVQFSFYVTAAINTDGIGVYLKPVGGSPITITDVKYFIERTHKR